MAAGVNGAMARGHVGCTLEEAVGPRGQGREGGGILAWQCKAKAPATANCDPDALLCGARRHMPCFQGLTFYHVTVFDN